MGQISPDAERAEGLAEQLNNPRFLQELQAPGYGAAANCGICFQILEGPLPPSSPILPAQVLRLRRGRAGYSQHGCLPHSQGEGTSPGNLAGFY